ncbi:sensor histidine kinase [Streptomyces sp. NPDC051776]|uniref:sensor histidine kinase n=1 Tax=Streptomyces sp. NPDC051776 TaxID=3155414 RepID=UPI003439103D
MAQAAFNQRYLVGWHVATVVLLALASVLALVEGESSGRAVTVAVLATAMACWYALIGAGALRTRSAQRGLWYLPVAWALFAAMVWLAPSSAVVLTILYPQLFVMLKGWRWWIAGAVVLSGVSAAALTAGRGSSAAALLLLVAGPVVAMAFGAWVGGISHESAKRAELIAELASTRAELLRAHHREGVLAERERLAHEIHDTLAQGFTSVHMLIRGAEATLESSPDEARERLRLAARTAGENLAEARSLVAALGPVALRQGSLPDALARLGDRFGQETGAITTFGTSGMARVLPADQEVIMVRVLQEALANVRKHAGAQHVRIHLSYHHDRVELQIGDDGRGFTTSSVDRPGGDVLTGGFGLHGMHTRVRQIGGALRVTSSPGSGTTVTVCL